MSRVISILPEFLSLEEHNDIYFEKIWNVFGLVCTGFAYKQESMPLNMRRFMLSLCPRVLLWEPIGQSCNGLYCQLYSMHMSIHIQINVKITIWYSGIAFPIDIIFTCADPESQELFNVHHSHAYTIYCISVSLRANVFRLHHSCISQGHPHTQIHIHMRTLRLLYTKPI